MSVVDMHRWYRNMKSNNSGNQVRQEIKPEPNSELMVRKFSDILCKNLEDRIRRQTGVRPARGTYDVADEVIKLERIRRKYGSATQPATKKQLSSGCTVGTSVNSTCYIRRKYVCPEGKFFYKQTCWYHSICEMLLFKEIRKDEIIDQTEFFLEEHEYTED